MSHCLNDWMSERITDRLKHELINYLTHWRTDWLTHKMKIIERICIQIIKQLNYQYHLLVEATLNIGNVLNVNVVVLSPLWCTRKGKRAELSTKIMRRNEGWNNLLILTGLGMNAGAIYMWPTALESTKETPHFYSPSEWGLLH